MAKASNDSDGSKKGGGYPYYPYKRSLGVATAAKEHGGERGGVPRAVIAGELDMDQSSASFTQLVSSAKIFGMVEGTRDLHLTELARQYFYPTNDSESRLAELSFLVTPPVFAALVKEFDGSVIGKVPIIANILRRKHNVPESWKLRAAQIFVGTAQDIDVLDQNGFLRYALAKHTAERAPTTKPDGDESSDDQSLSTNEINGDDFENQKKQARKILQPVVRSDSNVWFYTEGQDTIRIETPPQISRSLWKRLKKFVDLIEPDAPNTEVAQSGSTDRAP